MDVCMQIYKSAKILFMEYSLFGKKRSKIS